MAGSNVDYSDLLDAIDFGEIATGVVGAGAALVAVYLAIKGVNIVLSFLKGSGDTAGSSSLHDEFKDMSDSEADQERYYSWDEDKKARYLEYRQGL